ncbi:MAG: hypothetical protein HC820_01590 [Hydrococcus sp. RM1_1_31]|nr:hypothetical protein [Hydrococcus sp. RM1_1_31]
MRKKTEKPIEQELAHNLDDLIDILDRIPPYFEREYELAKEFDLDDYRTAKNLFRDTKIQLSLIKLLASSMTDKLRRVQQDNKLTCSYSLHLHLDCLPQENERWVCRASLSDWCLNAIEYGQTREESIAKALYAIASLCRNQLN